MQESDSQPKDLSTTEDLWKAAYDRLGETQQNTLSAVEITVPTNTNGDSDRSQTTQILDNIIQTTKVQYEEYLTGGFMIKRLDGKKINIHELSAKIINAAWSFKDVIGAVATFDPTGHASSAWAIVSFGLTVCE